MTLWVKARRKPSGGGRSGEGTLRSSGVATLLTGPAPLRSGPGARKFMGSSRQTLPNRDLCCEGCEHSLLRVRRGGGSVSSATGSSCSWQTCGWPGTPCSCGQVPSCPQVRLGCWTHRSHLPEVKGIQRRKVPERWEGREAVQASQALVFLQQSQQNNREASRGQGHCQER